MAQRLLKNSTIKVAEALQKTLMEHANQRKSVVCSEILMLTLIEQKDSIVLKIFDELKLDAGAVRRKIADKAMNVLNELPDFDEDRIGHLQMSEDIKRLFDSSEKERNDWGYIYFNWDIVFGRV